ncbi:hypothetical protein GCM10010168_48880 [Actinoplanes ianthinogenes]|uniref:AMP-binding enzyme C-terminal domain-containing protein n=1 Tax=Actinoplanes ianthinogenes TaxID=122358 RepID=A0ABM7LNL9_9ACTN|nr:AMP-binding protein [Actinoplanes ianthinogenes]BCJ40813.1 hypothetical protein Aiant_14700 [Actinoplanes ianthinogenes]GGR25032.1 hypothetical protein GCM10010168_48880 [Actinoplanes ianthinogenes]
MTPDACRAVGPDGRLVEPGELYSRSPYLMNGYHENPAATAACTTADGFLTSGDIVIRDEEGFISIVDRVKDVIITGGVNVYPRDVEEVLLTHPSVTECAVVGEPDDRWGERDEYVKWGGHAENYEHEHAPVISSLPVRSRSRGEWSGDGM